MPSFLIEGFAGATGVNLNSREPLLGGPWAKVNGAAPDILISLLNRARGNSNTLARYVSAAVPQSADYDLAGRTFRQSGVGEWDVMLRASTTADTCYAVGYTGSGWRIRRIVNGSATSLGAFSQAWANNESKDWRVKIRTVNSTVTIQVLDALRGGNVILSANDTNGARITTAGRVGLRINGGTTTLFENRGYHVARLTGFALPADPRPRAARPAQGPLATRILGKANGERAAERAAILAEAGAPPGWQVTKGATTYTLSLPQGVRRSNGGLLIPEVACSPAPTVPLDPPYIFTNPPIQVPDGTVREDINDDGDPVVVENFAESPLEALRQMVADCVLRDA